MSFDQTKYNSREDLSNLDLSKTDFANEDVMSLLAFLKANPEIKSLELSRTKLTDAGAILLAQNLVLQHLESQN